MPDTPHPLLFCRELNLDELKYHFINTKFFVNRFRKDTTPNQLIYYDQYF